MTWARIVTALAGIGAVVCDGAISILGMWPSAPRPVEAIFHAAVGGMWIAAGLVAWARRPALRIGRLMCAVGFVWLLSEPWWPAPLPATEPWWPAALPATVHYETATARLRVALQDDRLLVEVSDDGIGGVRLENGTGLRGLADRVGALGGRLKLDSPCGTGTRILAEIPCAS